MTRIDAEPPGEYPAVEFLDIPPMDASLATPERPTLVLMHGWMDVGASFQFVVDELARLEGEARHVIAADWRGFGGSTSGEVDAFWFQDYLGDLEALLDAFAPGRAVDLAGHSMGGNVVMTYAGVRPARVRESPLAIECRLFRVVPHGTGPLAANYVIGEVVYFHVARHLLDDGGRVDPRRVHYVSRMGGDWYDRATPETMFELPRP